MTQIYGSLQAIILTKEICKNVDNAAKAAGDVGYTVVLRGDSTLRGHFPQVWQLNYLNCIIGFFRFCIQQVLLTLTKLHFSERKSNMKLLSRKQMQRHLC